tara:strand:+ start:191 stop:310 length:120 start_codon:yes stop_codon:yes gene_type:complete
MNIRKPSNWLKLVAINLEIRGKRYWFDSIALTIFSGDTP